MLECPLAQIQVQRLSGNMDVNYKSSNPARYFWLNLWLRGFFCQAYK